MATTSTNTRDKDGAEGLAGQLGLNRLGEQLPGLGRLWLTVVYKR